MTTRRISSQKVPSCLLKRRSQPTEICHQRPVRRMQPQMQRLRLPVSKL